MHDRNPFIQNRHRKSSTLTNLLIVISALLAAYALVLPVIMTLAENVGR